MFRCEMQFVPKANVNMSDHYECQITQFILEMGSNKLVVVVERKTCLYCLILPFSKSRMCHVKAGLFL